MGSSSRGLRICARAGTVPPEVVLFEDEDLGQAECLIGALIPGQDLPEVLAVGAPVEPPTRVDEVLDIGVEDRRGMVFRACVLFGFSAIAAARQLHVGVAVIEDDLAAIREEARRRVAEFDPIGELGLALAQYESLAQVAMFEASAARSPFGKAALLSQSLRAIQLRIRLLLATGRLPRAARRFSASIALSTGRDLRRLSDADLREHVKEIVRQHARADA